MLVFPFGLGIIFLQIIGLVLIGALFVGIGIVIVIIINYFTDVFTRVVDWLLDLFND